MASVQAHPELIQFPDNRVSRSATKNSRRLGWTFGQVGPEWGAEPTLVPRGTGRSLEPKRSQGGDSHACKTLVEIATCSRLRGSSVVVLGRDHRWRGVAYAQFEVEWALWPTALLAGAATVLWGRQAPHLRNACPIAGHRLRGHRDALQVSDPTLSKHLKQLDQIEYIRLQKGLTLGGRTKTWAEMTVAGSTVFEGHVAFLREVTKG